MAYQTPWQFDFNHVNAGFALGSVKGLATYQAHYVYAFPQGKVGNTSAGHWELVGSSDGVSAGMDSVERLGATFDPSKWVRASAEGTAHSWFVLRAPDTFKDGDKPVHLIGTFIGGQDYWFRWYFVSGEVSGGSVTNTPTAEHVWGGYNGSAQSDQMIENVVHGYKIHGALATDGSLTIHSSRNDSGRFCWSLLFLTVKNRLDTPTYDPVAGRESAPWGVVGFSTVAGTTKHLIASAPAPGHVVTSSLCIGTSWTYLGNGGQGARMPDRDHSSTFAAVATPAFQVFSSTSFPETTLSSALSVTADRAKLPGGEWVTFPAWLFSGAQHSSNGNLRYEGIVPDMYLVNKSCVDGDVFPATGNVEYVVVGSFLLPGNAEPQL